MSFSWGETCPAVVLLTDVSGDREGPERYLLPPMDVHVCLLPMPQASPSSPQHTGSGYWYVTPGLILKVLTPAVLPELAASQIIKDDHRPLKHLHPDREPLLAHAPRHHFVANDVGATHLGVIVDDLDSVCKELSAKGMRILSSPAGREGDAPDPWARKACMVQAPPV